MDDLWQAATGVNSLHFLNHKPLSTTFNSALYIRVERLKPSLSFFAPVDVADFLFFFAIGGFVANHIYI